MRRQWLKTLAVLAVLASPAAAQETAGSSIPDKGRGILEQAIEALGGPRFLNVRDITRRGRLYAFHRGELASPGDRLLYIVKFPGKEWQEYGKKGNIVYVYNNDEAWELDRQGIREMSPELIQHFHEGNRRDLDYLLRFLLPQGQVQTYYLGTEFADNRRAHVVEMVDENGESLKLLVDERNFLPMQLRYRERDALSGEWMEVVDVFGKYITIQGIQTPLHFSRERNGRRALEVSWTEVQYNTGVADHLFTRASLDERWKKVGKKK